MAHVVVVTGSARPESANSKLVPVVVRHLQEREDVTVTVANLAELNLPFMSGNTAPSQPTYEITDPHAQAWAQLIDEADGVVFVAPEYNHGLSAIQKNAIDWLYKEWVAKPLAVVSYGFYAGKHTIEQFKEINTVLQARLGESTTGLQLGGELDFDGTPKDEALVEEKLTATVDELLAAVAQPAQVAV